MERWNESELPAFYAGLSETGLVRRLLELARDEDLGPSGRDLTGEAAKSGTEVVATVVARDPGIAAGLAALPELLDVFGGELKLETRMTDGERFEPGEALVSIEGTLDRVVIVERTLLNLLSRLSGIATRTAGFVQAMRGAGDSVADLYDTRKTTPGLRVLEKYAVRCGGGCSHRLGLHDAVMFKDNHIAGVPVDQLARHAISLIERVRRQSEATGVRPSFIEFEVDTLEQLGALLTLDAQTIDVVLLDNMDACTLREAVARRDGARSTIMLEASGGVTLETIGPIALSGVDRISAGSLTHGAVSLDLGLDIG